MRFGDWSGADQASRSADSEPRVRHELQIVGTAGEPMRALLVPTFALLLRKSHCVRLAKGSDTEDAQVPGVSASVTSSRMTWSGTSTGSGRTPRWLAIGAAETSGAYTSTRRAVAPKSTLTRAGGMVTGVPFARSQICDSFHSTSTKRPSFFCSSRLFADGGMSDSVYESVLRAASFTRDVVLALRIVVRLRTAWATGFGLLSKRNIPKCISPLLFCGSDFSSSSS